MVRPLIQLDDVRQAALGRDEPQYDTRDETFGDIVATVARVYPVGHRENSMNQTLVDIQYGEHLAPWRKVPLGTHHAHGETDEAVPFSRRRQPYRAKNRNQMDGVSYDVRPGTRVLVGFLDGDLRAPIVKAVLKFNRQGEGGFPKELHGVDRWENGKLLSMVEAHPVDSAMAEYPRAVDSYNGTRIERDNRGNLYVQTTIDRESNFPGHNDIPASPAPEGNIGYSTRGARHGNQGRTTGKHPMTKDRSLGNIRDETAGADEGSWVARLASKVGRFFVSTRGSDNGRVYVEDKERDYLALRANGKAELHGEQRAILDSRLVHLGHDGAPHEIVLWPQLNDILDVLFQTFNSHTHGGIYTGESDTLPPNQDQLFYWQQHATECRSDVVFADKSAGSTPHKEEDPAGDSSAPDDEEDGVPVTTNVRGYGVERYAKNLGLNRWVRKVNKNDEGGA